MPIQIHVPELGESVVQATVGPWRKHEGERVAAGETLVELETDKVNLEVGAERAGVLEHIERKEGEDVKPGDVLGTIAEAAEGATPAPAQPPAAKETPKAPPPEQMKAAEGAKPAAPAQPPASRETPQAPTPAQMHAAEGTAPTQPPAEATRGNGKEEDKVTPVARRFAEERGVDIAQVTASVSGARVTKQDVEKFLEQQTQPATKPPTPAPPQPAPELTAAPSSAPKRTDREERIRMSRRRQTIAQRMVEAHQTAAILTTFNEIDMSAVMEIRARRKEAFQEKFGVGLGFMSFFVKAAIGALKAFPHLNAELQGNEIVHKHYYDIGIAVGAEEGLVVPVLRDADRMSFAEIERAIEAFVRKTQEGTLSVEDLRGGTFTITNGGVFGSLLSTPILNPPEVGILGLHKIEERPVAVKGQIVIRPMMYVALSYDHRIVDGLEAVQFLAQIKRLIEEPETLLLEG